MMLQSSSSLVCSSSSLSPRRHALPYFNLSNRSSSRFQLRSRISLRAQKTLPFPLRSTATEEIVETSSAESEFIEVGYLSDVHGLQGEMRVKHHTDFPELRLATPGKRWLRQQFSGRGKVVEVELEAGRGRPGDKSWIIKFRGIDSIDQAKQFVGASLLVRESDRPELEDGDFYSRDLIGMRVIVKETGATVGTVVNVYDNGGNDLLHVMLDSPSESSNGSWNEKPEMGGSGRLVWIPFVEAIVSDVDLDRKEMQINPPKGLLELNLRTHEKSKKERRLLASKEWKEKKKFQRRVIAAKKKLCELEQQHVFHGFRYGEKSQGGLLAEQIVSVNSKLLRQALQNYSMHDTRRELIEFSRAISTLQIGNTLNVSDALLTSTGNEGERDTFTELRESGNRLISEGKLATVLVLNGGEMGSRCGTEQNDSEVGGDSSISIIETIFSDDKKFIEMEQRAAVPVITISEASEVQSLEELFSRHDYFGFNSEKVWFLEEEKLPVVSSSAEEQKRHKILMKSPWEIHQVPIGSGGSISALSTNNILEDLIEMGVEYIELCSINERSVPGLLIFLGFVDSCKSDIGIRTFKDTKGLNDNIHIIVHIRSMRKLVKQIEKVKYEAILSSNSHVEMIDKKWVDVVPSTHNSYEFHCSIGNLLSSCNFGEACMLEVVE